MSWIKRPSEEREWEEYIASISVLHEISTQICLKKNLFRYWIIIKFSGCHGAYCSNDKTSGLLHHAE